MMTFLTILALAILAYFAVAIALIFTQRVVELDNNSPMDFDPDDVRYRLPQKELEIAKARDGSDIPYRLYRVADGAKSKNVPLLVFSHGSTNHSAPYEPLAQMISAAGIADVVLPDMRGHGPLTQNRGVTDYVGQMEDDFADLIEQIRRNHNQNIIVGGHSLGGGFAVRFAAGKYRRLVDKAVLLCPYLNTRSPTNRPHAGGFTRVLYRRALGLAMLFGLRKFFKRLPTVQFNFGQDFRDWERSWMSTEFYNYATMMGFGPRQAWQQDVKKLPPFLVVIGSEDEVFHARQYQPTMSPLNPNGQYQVLEGVDHIGVSTLPKTVEVIEAFLGNNDNADDASDDLKANQSAA